MNVEVTALHKFIRKLRAIPALHASIFVFFIEANHCWVRAKDLAKHAATYENVVIEAKKKVDNVLVPGVWTTHQTKDQSNKHANFFLKQEKMHMLAVNHSHHPLVLLEEPSAALTKFGDQLRSYRQKNYTPSDASKESKVSYTGKGLGMCDDLVMAWTIALWWGANFLNDPEMRTVYRQEPVNVVALSHPDYQNMVRHTTELGGA